MFKKTAALIFVLALAIPVFAKDDTDAKTPDSVVNESNIPKIDVEHKTQGIYVFKINTKDYGNKIKPYVTSELTTVLDVFNSRDDVELVVNGGFFDPATGGPISYVIIDGETVETPFASLGLVESLAKANRLEKVLNRAEFRIMKGFRGKLSFDIQNRFTPLPKGKTLVHSLQAGPFVYPSLKLEEESFVVREGSKVKLQAADVLKKRERTVLGLKGDNLYIVIFAKQNKVTLQEVYEYCKKMRFDKAMALDGGSSTSLNYKDIEIYSSIGAQRKVKSFLIIEK